MYKGLYLLQRRQSIKHNECIMVSYGIIMACYPAHGPWRKEWGIWSISGATQNVVDTWVCYNQFSQYSGMFYSILQSSTVMLQSQMLWKACDGTCDEVHDCKSKIEKS